MGGGGGGVAAEGGVGVARLTACFELGVEHLDGPWHPRREGALLQPLRFLEEGGCKGYSRVPGVFLGARAILGRARGGKEQPHRPHHGADWQARRQKEEPSGRRQSPPAVGCHF
eukprot:scaffold19252_cov117-Isochrysis_galbana.AAC.4